jgi:hypothetical protein
MPDARAVHVAELEQEHRITRLPWTGRYAFSYPSRREICAPPVTDDVTYRQNVHEICHCIQGDCPRRWPHQPVGDGATFSCLQCDVGASDLEWSLVSARGLASRAYFERMRLGMGSYRRSPRVPQTGPAARRADRLMNFMETYAKSAQERVEWENRADLVATWCRERDDQPNSLVRRRAQLEATLRGTR